MKNADTYYKGGNSIQSKLPEEYRTEYIDSVIRKIKYDKKKKTENIEEREM